MATILVIGAGGAGLSAAIEAKRLGNDVTVLTKEYPTRSQTCMAQGGINAVLYDDEDSIERHIEDTLTAAKHLANEDAVRLMCEEAPQTIDWLERLGVPFSRTQEGRIAQRKLGGAYAPRACYAQDYTGLKILHTLYDYANKLGIRFLNERYMIDLFTEEERAVAATFLHIPTGEVEVYGADAFIFAGGGYSKVYGPYSTNSKAASGDLLAVARRAGCRLRHMEFIQFHPTALKNSSILISESARGAGGKIFNSKGERFVDELAPRDFVSQAIFDQMQAGEDIFLDITHLGETFINEELPQERKLAMLYEGIDPVYEKIPIKPAAHYTMGGIAVDISMRSDVSNLFAVGECSEPGVHGANRLGGNSLLEIVAFGRIAARSATDTQPSKNTATLDAYKQQTQQTLTAIQDTPPKENFYEYKNRLHTRMYLNCGIKRNGEDLRRLIDFLDTSEAMLPAMGVRDTSQRYNTNLIDFLEYKNMLTIASQIARSALRNDRSIGAHYRTDSQATKEGV